MSENLFRNLGKMVQVPQDPAYDGRRAAPVRGMAVVREVKGPWLTNTASPPTLGGLSTVNRDRQAAEEFGQNPHGDTPPGV